MLLKTIKTILTISIVSVFLSACSMNTKSIDKNSSSFSKISKTEATLHSINNSDNNSDKHSKKMFDSDESNDIATPSESIFYFNFDSSKLLPSSHQLLNEHANALNAKPRAIRLEGHADERGTREYNIALGERRAQAVRTYFISQGVLSPIEVISYGEESPAIDRSDEYAWQRNRRVEIK